MPVNNNKPDKLCIVYLKTPNNLRLKRLISNVNNKVFKII